MWLLRGFSSYLLISCMGKRWHPDKSSFTSAQRTSYVCWNFLEKMSCRLLGGGTNAGNTSPSVAQRPGKAVFWHLDIHPGEGLQYSGAHGASEDRGAWVEGWVEMILDVFSVIIPDRIGASSRLPTFLKPLKVCKARLVTKLPPPLTGARFSCFPIISPSY